MTEEKLKIKRNHHPERITLSSEAFQKVENWLSQIQPFLKGSGITRTNIVNEIIKNHSETLSSSETEAFIKTFFDPAKALIWAANEIKSAKKTGTSLDVGALVRDSIIPKLRKDPNKRKSEKISKSEKKKRDEVEKNLDTEIK